MIDRHIVPEEGLNVPVSCFREEQNSPSPATNVHRCADIAQVPGRPIRPEMMDGPRRLVRSATNDIYGE
jgi:hypothetical protein